LTTKTRTIPTATDDVNSNDQPQSWKGVAAAVVGALVLTAVASVAPTSARKLVLFAVAFGLGIGWIVAASAKQFGTPRNMALLWVPLLTLVGLGFIAQRTWREFQALQRAADIENPQSTMPPPMLEAIAHDDPQTAQMLERARSRAEPDFLQYLAVRTRPLGEWRHPWPVVFWIGELALASVAGVLIAHRLLQHTMVEPQPGEPVAEGAESA
jgi:glycerol uptake facilitator-like aquaporin